MHVRNTHTHFRQRIMNLFHNVINRIKSIGASREDRVDPLAIPDTMTITEPANYAFHWYMSGPALTITITQEGTTDTYVLNGEPEHL